MKKLGIVVLNYKNYNDTIKCVNSILAQKDILLEIVIVDNGSNNNSFIELKKIFGKLNNIKIIKSKNNLGYARGNNIGIDFLYSKGYKNIFIANSDLLFSHQYTLFSLNENHEKNIGLVVPIIQNIDGTIDQRVSYKKNFLYLRIIRHIVYWFFGKNVPSKSAQKDGSIEYTKRLLGLQTDRYVVSGSGFLLTDNFFKFYQGLYSKTFLYGEEMATIVLLHKAHLFSKVVNCPPITHHGGASTPIEIRNHSNTRRKIVQHSYYMILKLIFTPFILIKRNI